MAKEKKLTVIKLETGTVYQKEERGTFYYRYQINGQRKAVSLKTKNKEEALEAVKAYLPVVNATTTEVIAAHVLQARSLEGPRKTLPLADAWNEYNRSPERATPRTVEEQKSYEATLAQFIEFVKAPKKTVRDITPQIADAFAKHLRRTQISVDTHNRKIKRLRKIFEVLREYRDDPNPFQSLTLRRKEQEEQEFNVRRLSFTREQEQQLLDVLDDKAHKVLNKPEIRVLYYLGMFTGQRLKDCVLLRWDKIDLERRRIWIKQFKTGKEVTIPIAGKLEVALRQALEWRSDEYVLPKCAARYKKTDANGKNVGNNLINIDALRVIRWIGLTPSVELEGRKKKVTVYGFHSLRHSFASHCAEAGVPKAVVLSILGTDSDIVDKYYTHIGDEAQQKAIAAVAGEIGGKSDRDRIEEALALIRDSASEPVDVLRQIVEILQR